MAAEAIAQFRDALGRLDERVRRWSPARWNVPGADGRLRADAAYALAEELAELARQAGNGGPEVDVPRVAAHGIADQLLVLGTELIGALTDAPTAAAHAEAGTAAIARTEAAL